MMRLKCCPRCLGDMFREVTNYGAEWTCLQCGHTLTGDSAAQLVSLGALPAPRTLVLRRQTKAQQFDRAADRDLAGGAQRLAAA